MSLDFTESDWAGFDLYPLWVSLSQILTQAPQVSSLGSLSMLLRYLDDLSVMIMPYQLRPRKQSQSL